MDVSVCEANRYRLDRAMSNRQCASDASGSSPSSANTSAKKASYSSRPATLCAAQSKKYGVAGQQQPPNVNLVLGVRRLERLGDPIEETTSR